MGSPSAGAPVTGGHRETPLWHGRPTGVDDVPVRPPSALGSLRAPDVLVVGLGATGLTAIGALARAGASVIGVDAGAVGSGAAGANGGFLLGGLASFHHDAVARHGRAVASRWYARSLDELARTFEEEPTARRTGSLRSAADDAEVADLRRHRAALRRDGIAAEPTTGPLGPALLLPDDGTFDPMARCRRLARVAVEAGAVLVGSARAVVSGEEVVVAGRRLGPGATLVAVDGGLEEVVSSLADEVTSIRLQMLGTAPDPADVLERPTYHRWGHDYAQQLPDGRVAIGGGRDLEDAAARRGASRPTALVQRHLDALAVSLGVTAPVTHRWASRSAYTDDLLPIDRRVAPRVHVLGGYSGHGNVLGTMLARVAAGRILDELAATRGGRRARR